MGLNSTGLLRLETESTLRQAYGLLRELLADDEDALLLLGTLEEAAIENVILLCANLTQLEWLSSGLDGIRGRLNG